MGEIIMGFVDMIKDILSGKKADKVPKVPKVPKQNNEEKEEETK